jgi:predicted RNase H-like HicB family nuclease
MATIEEARANLKEAVEVFFEYAKSGVSPAAMLRRVAVSLA